MSQTIDAQNFEEIEGSYSQGSTAGIYIYNDGTFALYGYATLVFGEYKIENEEIAFTPDIPKQAFSIMGRKNMKIENGANFTFTRKFDDDGPTFIKIDEANFQPLFDESNEGGRPNYTIDFAKKPKTISLGLQTPNNKHIYNTNTFSLDNEYNEFLVFYYPTNSAQKPFRGQISTKEGDTALVCGWGTFIKAKVEEEESGEDEMIRFLNQYKKERQNNKDAKEVYLNDQLKTANGYNYLSEQENIFDITNYVFDEKSNKYIHKDLYQKGKNYRNAVVNDYHDEDILLKYQVIETSSVSNTKYNELKILKKPLLPNEVSEKRKEKEEEELEQANERLGEEIQLDLLYEQTYIEPIPEADKTKKKKEKKKKKE